MEMYHYKDFTLKYTYNKIEDCFEASTQIGQEYFSFKEKTLGKLHKAYNVIIDSIEMRA